MIFLRTFTESAKTFLTKHMKWSKAFVVLFVRRLLRKSSLSRSDTREKLFKILSRTFKNWKTSITSYPSPLPSKLFSKLLLCSLLHLILYPIFILPRFGKSLPTKIKCLKLPTMQTLGRKRKRKKSVSSSFWINKIG